MKDCEEYQDACSAYLDGELTKAEETQLKAHLAVCPACEAYYKALQDLHTKCEPEKVTIPENLHENIMACIMEEAQKNVVPIEKRRRRPPMFTMVAAAAVVVILATTGRLGDLTQGQEAFVQDSGIDTMSAQPDLEESSAAGRAADKSRIIGTEENTAESRMMSKAASADTDKQDTNAVKVDLSQVPASIIENVYAFCYIAQGTADMVPDFGGTLTAQDTSGTMSYFIIKNNMSTLEKALGKLQEGGYEAQPREDISGVTLDSKVENGLIIVVQQ